MSAAKGRLIVGLGCVLVALLSGINNLGEFVFMLLGPDTMQSMQSGVGAWMQESTAAYIAAMESGVFRWGWCVMGGLGCLAAVTLLLGGLALIAGQRVSRFLLTAWGLYGVMAGPIITVLMSRYLLPEVAKIKNETMSDGAVFFSGLMSLVSLWLLPVGLLLLLRLPFMQADAIDGDATDQSRVTTRHEQPTTEQDTRAKQHPALPPQSSAERESEPGDRNPVAADVNLRDDPWNDPHAT